MTIQTHYSHYPIFNIALASSGVTASQIHRFGTWFLLFTSVQMA